MVAAPANRRRSLRQGDTRGLQQLLGAACRAGLVGVGGAVPLHAFAGPHGCGLVVGTCVGASCGGAPRVVRFKRGWAAEFEPRAARPRGGVGCPAICRPPRSQQPGHHHRRSQGPDHALSAALHAARGVLLALIPDAGPASRPVQTFLRGLCQTRRAACRRRRWCACLSGPADRAP